MEAFNLMESEWSIDDLVAARLFAEVLLMG